MKKMVCVMFVILASAGTTHAKIIKDKTVNGLRTIRISDTSCNETSESTMLVKMITSDGWIFLSANCGEFRFIKDTKANRKGLPRRYYNNKQ